MPSFGVAVAFLVEWQTSGIAGAMADCWSADRQWPRLLASTISEELLLLDTTAALYQEAA